MHTRQPSAWSGPRRPELDQEYQAQPAFQAEPDAESKPLAIATMCGWPVFVFKNHAVHASLTYPERLVGNNLGQLAVPSPGAAGLRRL